MAYILAIETATKVCSIALIKKDEVIGAMDFAVDKSHSEWLAQNIHYLLQPFDIELGSLSAICISKGPGSYTGLRIGTSLVKGMCYTLDKPLIAISTLAAQASYVNRFNKEEALLCPMMDARRMEVYCTVFDASNSVVIETQAKVIEEGAFSELLDQQPILFFGNGMEKCKEILGKHPNARFIDQVGASASYYAALAWACYQQKQFEDLIQYQPYYLKEYQPGKIRDLLK